MNRAELDRLWFEAMRQSTEAGEPYIRYHFAALVAAAEREACADIVMAEQATPHGLAYCEAAIRARITARKGETK